MYARAKLRKLCAVIILTLLARSLMSQADNDANPGRGERGDYI